MKIYAIEEKVARGERNKRASHCFVCGEHGVERCLPAGEGFAFWLPRGGKRYVCSEHYSNNGLISYHANARSAEREGVNVIGSEKSTPLARVTVGTEIECMDTIGNEAFTSLRALVEGCMVCRMESDCTVDGEMPTSAMMGLARLSKVLQSLEMHKQLDALNNENCGAHVHVACNDVQYVRRYYHSIFLPLYNYIDGVGSEKRVEFFGSDFRYYASRIDENTNPTNHTNVFNTQHRETLELRLPRVIGHKQYLEVVKFWREVGCYINNFDFHKDADAMTRKANARKCGEALVKIAKKYF